MKRILIAIVALSFIATGANAWWQSRDSNYNNAPVAVATTTWNPSDKGSGITLSGGNLVATTTSATSVRAIASHTTGKYYFSAVIGTNNNLVQAGICNATYAVSSNIMGNAPDCVGIAATTGSVFTNGGGIGGGGGAIAVGAVLDIAIDTGAKLLWYRVNNGSWFGNGAGDPVAATGGANFASTNAGPYFPAASFSVGSASSVTANFGGSAYTNAAPSGYGNW